MHGNVGLAQADIGVGLHGYQDGAAPAGDMNQVAVHQQPACHVLRVHLQRGFGNMAEQPPQRAGAAHTVPLVALAAGRQGERITRIARLGDGFIDGVDKPGPSVRRGKNSVFKQALGS